MNSRLREKTRIFRWNRLHTKKIWACSVAGLNNVHVSFFTNFNQRFDTIGMPFLLYRYHNSQISFPFNHLSLMLRLSTGMKPNLWRCRQNKEWGKECFPCSGYSEINESVSVAYQDWIQFLQPPSSSERKHCIKWSHEAIETLVQITRLDKVLSNLRTISWTIKVTSAT